MIMVVPVLLGMPALVVFVPPAMVPTPAAFTRRLQFAALVIGLLAVAAVVLDGLMQIVLGVLEAMLALLDTLGMNQPGRGENPQQHQNSSQKQRF